MPGTERFPVVETTYMLPGNCFLCSGIKGPFIDTRIQKPMYGHYYLCFDCVTEMYRMFPQPVVEKEPESVSITKEEYEAKINGLRDDLIGPLNSLLGALVNPPDVSPAPVEPQDDVELSDGDEGTEPSADKSAEDVSEPPVVEGPISVPSDRSDELSDLDPFKL